MKQSKKGKMSLQQDMESYITDHFEEAVQNHCIKPYYQPIVRTISETVSSAEALARWEDPVLGLLYPGDFIPVLEKKNLIAKLDFYLLEQICIDMSEMQNRGYKLVPVSFNLSGADCFDNNLLEIIEMTVRKYGIARDMINVEINESVLMDNQKHLRREIQRLRDGGYQVWLDDFGSSFSSQKVLKEYKFDELKLDPFFLDNFDERAREILRSTVQMAKRLGMRTHAKGVETEEQYQFLKGIGCEKVQGRFFSGPLNRKEFIIFSEKCGISMEMRAWKSYYDRIGRIDYITDRSLAIVEFDNKNFHFLFMNDEFNKICRSLGIVDNQSADFLMNAPASALSRKFRYLQEHTRAGGDFSQMDFCINGRYFRLRSKCISENQTFTANQVEIVDMTKEGDDRKSDQLDYIFRVMYSLYDIIFLIHSDGTYENLMRSEMNGNAALKKLGTGGVLVNREVIKQYIHPEDLKEFLEFTDQDTLKERLKNTERGYETRYYRSKLSSAGYVWKAHTIQYIPDTDMLIYSTKTAPLYQRGLIGKIVPGYMAEAQDGIEGVLWQKLKISDTINLFWKDTDRRILGVNKKFLDTFGIQDVSALVGKTDEEMHWLVNDNVAREDEIFLLEQGSFVRNRVEKCIIKGVVHTILTSKEPIYRDGKIIGILGYFLDIDELRQKGLEGTALNTRDEVTGLLSAHGMIDVVSEYVEGWNTRKENFAVIRITFAEQKQNYADYGSSVSQMIARGIAEILQSIGRHETVIARLYAGSYVLMQKCVDKESVNALIREISARMKNVHKLAGCDVTIYPEIQVLFADKVQNVRELIAVATGGTEIDIAQRKQLEDKLNYYNIQLETVVDAIPGGIAMYQVADKNAHLIYASRGVGEISGRTSEEFRATFEKDRRSGMAEEDMELVSQAIDRAVRERTELNVTYRLHHVNGTVLWVNMRGRVIGEQNGYPLLLAVFRNMSETTSIYESILDESFASVMVSAEADGEILYANRSAVRVSRKSFGGSARELYEQVIEMCTPESRTVNESNTNDANQYEIVLNNRNLLVYHVQGMWNGRAARICYISDITAKYMEERAKAERESLLYLQAISSSYSMIVTFNLTKNQYTIRYNSDFLGYDWSGYATYDEMISSVKSTIPEEEEESFSQYLAKFQIRAYHGGTRFFENEHTAYDCKGNLHWVSDRVVYAEDPVNGDILGISLSMVIDDRVREQNEQRELLEKALDEANSANRAKSQFLSNMSHDIRTPMNAIMGYSAIASEHMDDPKRIEDCLKKILFSGKHLQELINDILDMSRIEAGKETLEYSCVSVDEMEKEVLAIVEPMTEQKKIELTIDTEEVTHRTVRIDMTKIRRIMVNILGNASKFTGEHGRIICRITEQECGRTGRGLYVFQVKDSGIGMSREFLTHIYDMFAREQTSTSTHLTGTGLGMAISKKYVDLMGGTIDVKSEQGVGTVVTVKLELEWSHGGEMRDEDLPKADVLTGKRVLLVDDNEINREIAGAMLEEIGMETDMASDGKEAVEKLECSRSGTYDFVLMDIQMPVMDGVTAAKLIRSSNREYLRQIPIIALTANAFVEDIRCCLDAGMDGHIAKPFSREDIVRQCICHMK